MKKYFFLICFLLIITSINTIVGQQYTTQGKEFWLSLGSNYDNNLSTTSYQIRIVTEHKADVTFTFTSLNVSETVTLEANTVYTKTLTLPECQAVLSGFSQVVSKNTLYITSDQYISVYAINLRAYTTEASLILPVTTLGNHYQHISYNSPGDGYTLVAVEDDTEITTVGEVNPVKLNKGEVYSNYDSYWDLTGRSFLSNKPFAYFVTNSCALVPNGVTACDCLYEQLFPVSLWGNEFLVPVTIRGIERIRVVASQNGTTISQTGGRIISDEGMGVLSLNAGQFVEIEVYNYSKGCYIIADKPVAVASYLMGGSYGGLGFSMGDPSVAWVPPIEQSIKNIIYSPFIASGSSVLEQHYVLIIAPTKYKDLTTIKIGSGATTSLGGGYWMDNTASGYSYYSMSSNENANYHLSNPRGLLVMGYGLGRAESYYYLAASAMRKLNAAFYVNNIHYQDLDNQIFCNSDHINIKAVVKYEMHPDAGHLRWFVDDIEELTAKDKLEWSISGLTNGTYTISMVTKNTSSKLDTLKSEFTVVELTKIEVDDVNLCNEGKTTLNIKNPKAGTTYKWYDDEIVVYEGTNFETPVIATDKIYQIGIDGQGAACINDSRKDVKVSIVNLYLNPEKLPLYTHDELYSVQLESNAIQPQYNVTLGTLVTGINLSLSGLISGTVPESAGDEIKIFTITVEDESGCKADREYILRTCEPEPDLSKSIISYCLGDNAKPLQATSTSGFPLQWYANDRITKLGAAPSPDTQIEGEQIFYVSQINNVLNCEGKKAKITITISPLPKLDFTSSINKVCFGNPLILLLDKLKTTYYYNLYADNLQENKLASIIGESSTSIEISDKPERNKTYYISVTDDIGCKSSDLMEVNAEVVKLSISPDVLPMYRKNVDYEVSFQSNAESPIFTHYDGDLPNGLTLNHSGKLFGKVPSSERRQETTFKVQVEDINGCKTTREYVLDNDFFIPKVFTPNGDGVNDIFMQGYRLIIYDRLGVTIFEGADGWDGTYKNTTAPADIYFYKLFYINEVGETKVKTGYIGLEK